MSPFLQFIILISYKICLWHRNKPCYHIFMQSMQLSWIVPKFPAYNEQMKKSFLDPEIAFHQMQLDRLQ